MAHERYTFGHIPGVPVFSHFRNRGELMGAGIHAPSQAGIHGDSNDDGGAYSICISHGYEDNNDMGDRIIYVGSGGQGQNGEQITDQTFDDPRNKALKISCDTRRPVRVVRGRNPQSYYAPASGYRYDGLYLVERFWHAVGKKGYQMCFFELKRLDEGDGAIPHRRRLTSQRLNRMLRRSGR